MADWHPLQTLLPVTWVLPRPSDGDPFAEIRWLEVQRNGSPVWCFRAVTHEQPRRLIGYFETLKEASAVAYQWGLATLTPSSNFGLYENQPAL
ncbi:hypothetical protein [Subtercola sp. RTI3]|uniref:hypothetical protein n=1 Tax=Subtercola sp. RTI3 TaxID=3048639 RepID=UPI002B232439|nr:hypothetical protein [Subtercola sp. RTI3]MEA9986306.1 hypothetical protein [Subtercola sp. RTI3]